jgi:hypothetical protein
MRIIWLVGMAMMVPVIGGPPQGTFLHGRAAQPGQDELKPAASFERAMRKIAMVAGSNAKHPHQVKAGTKPQAQRGHIDQENAEARKVQAGKWQCG